MFFKNYLRTLISYIDIRLYEDKLDYYVIKVKLVTWPWFDTVLLFLENYLSELKRLPTLYFR